MKCTKCNIEKSESSFKYFYHKRTNKRYQRNVCVECTSEQSRQYRLKMKGYIQPEKIIEPVVPESQTGSTRVCQTCELEKPVSEFYIKYRTKCKRCVLDHNKKRELEEGSGTRWMVHSLPNKFFCEEQRIELFNLMERLGWIFSTEKQVWFKPGFKDKDKNFYFGNKVIKHKEKVKGMVRHIPPRRFTDKEIEDILNKRSMGMTYDEISDIYDSSHTTIRKWVREYYEKKKDEKQSN